jgi:uncharacterized protein YcgL (UPF0745 family)
MQLKCFHFISFVKFGYFEILFRNSAFMRCRKTHMLRAKQREKKEKLVKIDIYKSIKNGDKYLSVPSGTDVTTLQLPEDTDPDILSLSPFKTELELDPNKLLITLDQKDVKAQIDDQGYAIHGAKVKIEIARR